MKTDQSKLQRKIFQFRFVLFKMALFRVLLTSITILVPVICVYNGNKQALQKTPFIVYGEGTGTNPQTKQGPRNRFAGVIINERFVLTTDIVTEK